MAEYVWMGKPHPRQGKDGPEMLMPRQKFEPTEAEIRSFGDLMRRSDRDTEESEQQLVTSTPNPDVPDVPQKGMLHQPPMDEEGHAIPDMPQQLMHRMPPGQRVEPDEGEPRRRGRPPRSAEDASKD